MKFGLTRLSAMLVVFLFIGIPALAVAQSSLPTQIVPTQCNDRSGGCQSICDIAELAQNILNYGVFLAVVLSAVLFAWAGWSMLTAGGNSEQYAKGKKIFGSVIVGLIIILIGWIVVDTLMRTLVGTQTGLPWNEICRR